MTLASVMTAAAIDSWNPCAFGVLILYLTLLLAMGGNRKHAISFGFYYLAAIFLTYFLIGLGTLHVIHYFGISHFFGWVSAILLVLIGFVQIKSVWWPSIRIPGVDWVFAKCHVPTWNPRFTAASAIVLGVLVGLCEFPCSGGIYLGVVNLLATRESFWSGLRYLLIYNLIFILPLVVIYLFGTSPAVLEKLKKIQISAQRPFQLISGWLMFGLGIFLLLWLSRII